jgi:hypothetical protein
MLPQNANTLDMLRDLRQQVEETIPFRTGVCRAACGRCLLIINGRAIPIAEALEIMDDFDEKFRTHVAEAAGDDGHVRALCLKLRSDSNRDAIRQMLHEIIEVELLPSLAEGGVGCRPKS